MKYTEIGTSGLKENMGFIEEAYSTSLNWPTVQPLYSRIRRSDPEISVVRNIFASLSRGVSFEWELPDEPSDGDKAAAEFAEQVMADIDGGPDGFIETMVSHVPFMGWGWWEVVPGLRDPKWTPPGGDEWRSTYNDKKIGIRRLAWRDSSSLDHWEFSDTGKLLGMVQQDWPNPPVTLPIQNSLHLTFGDNNNPEGLSPLEAVWRLERIKYGLEVVQGIGFEHAAGYLDVTAEQNLTPADRAEINKAARAIMTAQEGNYAAWPKGITGELKDVPFSAAGAILDAIRYYGILKLMVYNMQWVALSSVSGSGSFAAMDDSSSMFMVTYNAMMRGFASQLDAQIGKRLFQWNKFPGMTRRPKLTISGIEKNVSLAEIGALLGPLKNTMPLGDEDFVAIRKHLKFLPETLPEVEDKPEPEPQPEPEPEETPTDEEAVDENGDPMPDEATREQAKEMALQTAHWQRYLLRHPEALNG